MKRSDALLAIKNGRFIQTAAVQAWIGDNGLRLRFATDCFYRHLSGEWGEVDEEDHANNEANLRHQSMLLSVWPIPDELRDAGFGTPRLAETKLWVITDPGHQVTTILFPSDY